MPETPAPDPTRVPYRVFTDPELYEREQETIYRGPTWSYVGLEAELPNPGDFLTTFVGDTPIVATRTENGGLAAWVNRCAHRGALVCREERGNATSHTCVYHQWCYDTQGRLIGLPFRRGIAGKGGMPTDFDLGAHGLAALRLESYRGLLFVSFDPALEPVADYLGPEIRRYIDPLIERPLRVLGRSSQTIRANWKLYLENTRDPYHASLLHLFHATFDLYRSSMDGATKVDSKRGVHCIITVFPTEKEDLSEYQSGTIRSYQSEAKLADASLISARKEFETDLVIAQVFPSLVVQQIQNTLALRQILPKGVDCFELRWTHFGFEDDDDELQQMRIKQANLVGPAGLISMEDGEATELVQRAVRRDPGASSVLEMGGREPGNANHLVTEGALRSFWLAYRELVGNGALE
jgi:anthranilate 1,2-dioxygenase large subunit